MTDPQGPWPVPEDVRERVSRLLCDLVAIPSYGGQEGAIIQYLVERFARQDIPCRVTAVDGKPLNVVAEIGQGPRTFLLNSHVDTVPPGDPALWATDPLTPVERDGMIFGRGAEDAKGCLAAMIVAFELLASTAHDRARPGGPDGRGGRGAGRTRYAGGDGQGIYGRRGDHRGVHAPGTDAGAQRGPAAGDRGDRQGRPRQRSGRRNQRHRGHGAHRVGPGPAGRRRETTDRPPSSGRPAW